MLDQALTEIVYGISDTASRQSYYRSQSSIDLAHLVMLDKRQLVQRDAVRALGRTIVELRETDFEALLHVPSPRGAFVAYEEFLIDKLGSDVGGRLHTARSRNDLNATISSMSVRSAWLKILETTAQTVEVLERKADEYADAPFPAFTHAQPAMPSTFGAYLANVGVSVALIGRQVATMERYFDSCPLGACAGYGTSIPIDPEMTAHLLGYTQGPLGSIAAVADRSAASLVLGQLAELSTLYSRVAADLQFWSSGAVGLVYFPDNLVGQSSIMPQKRNAFVLENIKARCASIIAAHMESLVSMKSAPYTNTIEVSSEAISGFSVAVEGYRGIATLVDWHLDGAVPQMDIARQVMRQGNVGATFEAEQAVMRDGVAFREAYNSVRTKMQMPSASRSVGESSQAVEPAEFGAGPSAVQTRRICNRLGEYREELSSTLEKVRGRVDKSAANLRKEVEELLR
ncbi:lyase family protein [Auritidibacter ignavus]|uniref:lyase family protein n=1 Tax=Auritidibacter ignavus TaxID=678932 RepID=UPI0024BB13F1|nr:lyase family protein [Auritidibacter ignavus]WHS27412.1 lyase family protein [Auritidibacter ignavus]